LTKGFDFFDIARLLRQRVTVFFMVSVGRTWLLSPSNEPLQSPFERDADGYLLHFMSIAVA
jgi:hypothetical protein